MRAHKKGLKSQPTTRIYLSQVSFAIATLFSPVSVYAEEPAVETSSDSIDVMSVTATREERASKDVPASIAVIDGEKIQNSRMFNISDALSDTPGVLINSQNGGYDARLIIRGAGLKAPYGIREIMILRDGVPITDPDSFTRLDFVDTQDIERIEVTKGPGNIYALGSAGGTVQIISRSVIDTAGTSIKVGGGDQGAKNVHLRSGFTFGENEDQALSVTYSHRSVDNYWRDHNEFRSDQLSLKHGFLFASGALWETELSYTKSDLQLPGSLSQEQYDEYLKTGTTEDNNSPFKSSARNSEIIFFNTKLEKSFGNFTYKPRLYLNSWSHFHPVTGVINESNGVSIIGTDQEISFAHELWGASELVAGFTLKQDRTPDSKKYKYADTQTLFTGRLLSTLSDRKGDLIEDSNDVNRVAGIFAQESMHPTDRLLVDIGARFDRVLMHTNGNEWETYSYATGTYVAGEGQVSTDKTFNLLAANVGVSYALTAQTSAYVNLARGDQVPSGSEVGSNPDLQASTAKNTEIGVKGRDHAWRYDISLYQINVDDEVISTLVDGSTEYQNAGRSEKTGAEFSGSARVFSSPSLGDAWLGTSYAWSDYTFARLSEIISGTSYDRSGNSMPYVPEHQYSLFMQWNLQDWSMRLQGESWGEYWLDNANTEKYKGYEMVSSLNLAYEHGAHSLSANIHNLSDKRYATEVSKDTRGGLSYSPAAPRTFLLSYQYTFE